MTLSRIAIFCASIFSIAAPSLSFGQVSEKSVLSAALSEESVPVSGLFLQNKELGSEAEVIVGEFTTEQEQAVATRGLRKQIAQWIKEHPGMQVYGNYYTWDPSLPQKEGRDISSGPEDEDGKVEARSGTFVHQVLDRQGVDAQITGVELNSETEKLLQARYGKFSRKKNIFTAIRIVTPAGINGVILGVGPVPKLLATIMFGTIASACGVFAKLAMWVLDVQTYFRFWNPALSKPEPRTKLGRWVQKVLLDKSSIGEVDENGRVKYAYPEKSGLMPRFEEKGQSLPLTKLGRTLEVPHSMLNFLGFEVAFGLPMYLMSNKILDLGKYTGHFESFSDFFTSALVSTGAQGIYEAYLGKLKKMELEAFKEAYLRVFGEVHGNAPNKQDPSMTNAEFYALQRANASAVPRSAIGSLLSVTGFALTRFFPIAGYSILGALGAYGLFKLVTLPKVTTDIIEKEMVCLNGLKVQGDNAYAQLAQESSRGAQQFRVDTKSGQVEPIYSNEVVDPDAGLEPDVIESLKNVAELQGDSHSNLAHKPLREGERVLSFEELLKLTENKVEAPAEKPKFRYNQETKTYEPLNDAARTQMQQKQSSRWSFESQIAVA